MQLNWSTYLLEIVNFLVLVWILKYFLYQPVLDVIAKRRAAIEKTAADAGAARDEAAALKAQFEVRLADWEKEKLKARSAFQDELAGLRRQRLESLETELAASSERARVRDERRLAAALEAREQDGLALAARFASRLLGRLASPALESQLAAAALADLAALPAERRAAIREALQAAPSIRVTSAWPLPGPSQDQFRQGLEALAGRALTCQFDEDPGLVAGVRILAGPWILRANLADELDGFTRAGRDD